MFARIVTGIMIKNVRLTDLNNETKRLEKVDKKTMKMASFFFLLGGDLSFGVVLFIVTFYFILFSLFLRVNVVINLIFFKDINPLWSQEATRLEILMIIMTRRMCDKFLSLVSSERHFAARLIF